MQVTLTVPDPLRVAEDTYLIRPLVRTPLAPGAIHVSSLVIQGAEPMLVDTSAAIFRDDWVEQVFSLVEPADVRWVFLSHDDADHSGNLELTLEMCPNATLVTSGLAPIAGALQSSPRQQRWVEDGEIFDIADRRFVVIRPPVFDSPDTRGLFDQSTGLYWTSDAFGTPVPDVVDHADEVPEDLLDECSTTFSSQLSPWHTVVDASKFGCWIDRVAALGPSAMVGAHGPVLSGAAIELAIARMRRLPDLAAAAPPAAPALAEILAANH